MKKLTIILTASAVIFLGGCSAVGGFVSIASSPTSSERKVPAEFTLTPKTGRVLVLVSQPAWINAQTNLRSYLTQTLNAELAVRLRFKAGQLVSYDQLAQFRSSRLDFHTLTPAKIGLHLQADTVLFVTVTDYGLYELADSGYYKGLLSLDASLVDTATGRELWPQSSEAKRIKVGFETGIKGMEAGVKRLAASAAYCVVRYFRDVSVNKFRIFDERTQTDWQHEPDMKF